MSGMRNVDVAFIILLAKEVCVMEKNATGKSYHYISMKSQNFFNTEICMYS